jgi:hypothetical protein
MENSSATNLMPLTLASGRKITLRESNGEDEGILSAQSEAESGRNIPGYLSRVIVDETGWKNPYTAADIMLWHLNDKYQAMVASRIHSLGAEMKFKWEFEENKNVFHIMSEDVSKFNWDFSKGNPPKEGEEGYEVERIKPYPLGMQTVVELMLTSKKQVRYTILNTLGEKKALEKSKDSINRNDTMVVRNLEWLNEQNIWQVVENFSIFSSREMKEIRADIEKNDPAYYMRVEITSPKGATSYVPVIHFADFFFPGEI